MVKKSSLFVNFERLCVDLKFKFNQILAREREALESSFSVQTYYLIYIYRGSH